jgi:general secretion pathway protein C
METLLRKHIWLVDLVAVAASAVWTARAASTVAEAKLAHAPGGGERLAVAGAAPPAAAPPLAGKEVDAIVGRNLLCLRPAPRPALRLLHLRLIAVMYAASPPAQQRWSVAVIRDEETMTAGPYTIGAPIRDATVTTIAATYVDLERAGGAGRQRLQLVSSRAQTIAAARGAREVDRAQIDALVADPLPLIRDVRAMPELRDGKPIGFRIFFRAQPLLSGLGFVTGDVIRSVGGIEMLGPAQALEAFQRFRSADQLSVTIERNGRTFSQDYRIN